MTHHLDSDGTTELKTGKLSPQIEFNVILNIRYTDEYRIQKV